MRALLIVVLIISTAHAQSNLPYKVGEHSFFDVFFSGIKVGSAEMKISREIKIDGISTFHIVGRGKTSPFFDWFFKVRDVYQTYLDTVKIRPVKFNRDIDEGGYKKKQTYIFKHKKGIVFFADTSREISSKSQDMLSALFFARTFAKNKLIKKKRFYIPIFMDEENYSLEILYLYNEKIKTPLGWIECMVFKPKMQEGRVFEDGETMRVWISNDRNNLLVKVETEIWAGKIKALLIGCKEVKYPLSISKEFQSSIKIGNY